MKEKVIKHMNEEHLDIIAALWGKFGSGLGEGARLVDIDESGLSIACGEKNIRVFFGKRLQEGESFKDAIARLCDDVVVEAKFDKIQASFERFISERKSVVISSFDGKRCITSYAPFIKKGDEIFIVISSVAPHYESIKSNPKQISIMFLQDECDVGTIFARIRASFECEAKFDDGLKEQVFDEFERVYPKDEAIAYIRSLSDFSVVVLKVLAGRFVRGFGAAYDTLGFKITNQAKTSNPHGHKI